MVAGLMSNAWAQHAEIPEFLSTHPASHARVRDIRHAAEGASERTR